LPSLETLRSNIAKNLEIIGTLTNKKYKPQRIMAVAAMNAMMLKSH